MSFGYNKRTRYADQYFEKGLTLAASGSPTGENALRVGKHLGSQSLIVSAAGKVTLPAAAKITVDIFESDTKDGTYAIHKTMPGVTLTAPSGGATYADGEDLLQIVLPDCKNFVKIRLTSAASAAGTFDLYLDYLAR